MVLLCFVLDVASFHPALLTALKQCLLQLGNLYALRTSKRCSGSATSNSIGVCCCTRRECGSGIYKLQVIYAPKGNFDLRDFQHRVSSIPAIIVDSLSLNCQATGVPTGYCQVSSLSELLNGEDGILSWGKSEVIKKVVMLSSQFKDSYASIRQTIQEAADQLVEIEFIQIEQAESRATEQLEPPQGEAMLDFLRGVSEFENCTLQRLQWDPWLLSHLAKRWFQELVTDNEGPVEVALVFSEALGDAVRTVFCSFHPAVVQLLDTIKPCQTCRCHGKVLEAAGCLDGRAGRMVCSVTGQELDPHDVAGHAILVGFDTVFYLPSFKNPPLPPTTYHHSGPPVTYKVVSCLALNTVDEGLLFGLPHTVVPSFDFEVDVASGESEGLEKNEQIFVALCQDLHNRDSGLLCTSTFDIETGTESSLLCYYALIPVGHGHSFVAKRIAVAEEVLPAPRATGESFGVNVPDHIKQSVSMSLSKVGQPTCVGYLSTHKSFNWLGGATRNDWPAAMLNF